jgi:hypothetical protein
MAGENEMFENQRSYWPQFFISFENKSYNRNFDLITLQIKFFDHVKFSQNFHLAIASPKL